MMKKYSVLLLYPDYMNENGDDTYYSFVSASSPKEAVAMARSNAVEAQLSDDPDFDLKPEDFAVLLVIEGHHYGVDEEESA